MKTKKHDPRLSLYVPNEPMYPNAAAPSYFVEKAVNALTAIVSTMGFIFAMGFLVTLS